MPGDESADAVVIGAGVIGASIALELSRAGWRVIVVDKAGGVGHGSTSASSAIVRFNYSTFAGVALAWESLHAWRDWATHLEADDAEPLAELRQTGMLVVPADAARLKATTGLFDRAGVPWEHWTADDIAVRAGVLRAGARPTRRTLDSGRGIRRRAAAGRGQPRERGAASWCPLPAATYGHRAQVRRIGLAGGHLRR
jgi:glycine/D-amino acid oxidase-like deaminating enzyme